MTAQDADEDCTECREANPANCMKVGYCRHRDGPTPPEPRQSAYVCQTPGFPHTNPVQNPTTTLAVDLAWLAENCFSVSVRVNDDRGCYQTVASVFDMGAGADPLDHARIPSIDGLLWQREDFESAEDMALCIRLNHLIRVQAYTRTAGGFYMAQGSDLARVVRRVTAMCEGETA